MKANNIVALFENTAQSNITGIATQFIENNAWKTHTWAEMRNCVINIASGLKKLGIKKGDRVSILSKTRYEWTLADLSIMATGGIVVPIYESNTASQAKYILEDSGTKIIFVENLQQYKKIQSIQNNLPHLQQIIIFNPKGLTENTEGVYSLDELIMLASADSEQEYLEQCKALKSSDDASFVYTSGTTGSPKGAILIHQNFLAEVEGALEVCPIQHDFVGLLFLPLAHILGRVAQFFHIAVGCIQCYAESIDKLVDNIADTKPHFMVSVPRIFEKIHSRTLQNVEISSENKKKIFHWALNVGKQHSRLKLNHQKIPLTLALQYKLAHQLVFKKLHLKMGNRIQFFISGGAPLSPEVALFFHAFGFTILEGYGLTETTAAISANRSHSIKIGTVGQPIKGVQFKIAADGEILVRGDVVFRGYFNNPQATKEAIDEQSWFHTGDIGEIDEQGFLKITDRKKDIIVTAGGKNIAPQNIENLMVSDPFISQVLIHGDKRKFISALIIPDQSQVQSYAKDNNIKYETYHELIQNKIIYNMIRQRIEDKNKTLPSYETIKKFALLSEEFSIEKGEMTPTLKLKRKIIYKKHADLLDSFYKE